MRRHNEDMAKRHDRAETHADDESIKVDKKYWSGMTYPPFVIFRLCVANGFSGIGGAAQDK